MNNRKNPRSTTDGRCSLKCAQQLDISTGATSGVPQSSPSSPGPTVSTQHRDIASSPARSGPELSLQPLNVDMSKLCRCAARNPQLHQQPADSITNRSTAPCCDVPSSIREARLQWFLANTRNRSCAQRYPFPARYPRSLIAYQL